MTNLTLTPTLLYSREGALQIDAAFFKHLTSADAELATRYQAARQAPNSLDGKAEAELLMAVAEPLEGFIAELFGIEKEWEALLMQHRTLAPLYTCKRLFVQRRATKTYKPAEAKSFDGAALKAQVEDILGQPFSELSFATYVMANLEDKSAKDALDICAKFAAWASLNPAKDSILFKAPKKLDDGHLVHTKPCEVHGLAAHQTPDGTLRLRHGFDLSDEGADLAHALDETNYCIFCHHQGRDSCSKGLKEKDGSFKVNTHKVTQAGCPLEERISEMHELKSNALPISALAMITVDNPMCAGTGHRICNDCMKGCIYQKQDPVNIPQAETRILKDILELPYGFEIYSLLTRWNPLNLARPVPQPSTGKNVLVAGLGPAGYTLAHHLMNDGHSVVGVDGLKIEPLAPEISGVCADGSRAEFALIKDVSTLTQKLGSRAPQGFGGVAEYGITVRWDKNYLTILRLLLERRTEFLMFGGVRFGSNLTFEQAWSLGFDHIALCMGAGKPTLLDIPNALARGVRTASDFLMGLQLTGAARPESIANMQVRLPVAVIGGGLTAIDTATEALAYYPLQVEKFLARYEALSAASSESAVRMKWSEEETQIAEEFIAHARALRMAKSDEEKLELLQSWGGSSVVYRRSMQDSPAYRLNHEEIEKALEEGIYFIPEQSPKAVEIDSFGHANALVLTDANGDSHTLPARTILVAAGTQPNTVLAREFPATLSMHGKYFVAHDAAGIMQEPQWLSKPSSAHVLTHTESDGRSISFFGDLHPDFAGNVVKAMGSAKQGYPVVSASLATQEPHAQTAQLFATLNAELRAFVHEVKRLTPTIVEVVVKAPFAARNFEPGQFYRLQNYEAYALKTADTSLSMEGLALTGAWVDKDAGLMSTIVLEMGGSSNLCAHLKAGEPVVLMGPTGTATHIPEASTMMLVGGGLGNAVLFSIGKAAREKGTKVLYFAGYKQHADRYKMEEIEAAADVVIWCCDEAQDFTPNRSGDKAFTGNIVEGIIAYARGDLGETPILTTDVEHMVVIGSDRMMAAVKAARHNALKPYLNPAHVAIGSINSPMQCMMKEICGQCLQKQTDPATGKVRFVYSCTNQDQCLDEVEFDHLNARLAQNLVQEKLTSLWISHCLASA